MTGIAVLKSPNESRAPVTSIIREKNLGQRLTRGDAGVFGTRPASGVLAVLRLFPSSFGIPAKGIFVNVARFTELQ